MKTTTLTAAVALALAAASSAPAADFVIRGMLLLPDAVIQPSAGSFIVGVPEPDAEGSLLQANTTVYNDPISWIEDFDHLVASSWLAMDAYGPKGLDGTAPYATGWNGFAMHPAGASAHVPAWTEALLTKPNSGFAVNGMNGDPVNGDGLSPRIYAGPAGLAIYSSIDDSFESFSAYSVVNDRYVDSIFLGHFVLSNILAEIEGHAVGFTIYEGPSSPALLKAPLDGSHAIANAKPTAYRIEYERLVVSTSLGDFPAIDMYLVHDPENPPPPPSDGFDEPIGTEPEPDQPPPSVPPLSQGKIFDLHELAYFLDAGVPDAQILLILKEQGLDPARFSAKQWPKMMNGLYNHRIAPYLDPPPTAEQRDAAIAQLVAAYDAQLIFERRDLFDSGTSDANADGTIDFADIARVIETGLADPERLRMIFAELELDPAAFPKDKLWKRAVKTFYKSHILPGFDEPRDKKQQKADRNFLISLR